MKLTCRKIGAVFLALSWATAGQAALAQAVPAASESRPAATAQDALMRDAGIDAILRALPEHMKLGLAQARAQGVPIPPQVEQALNEAAVETYRFESVRGSVMGKLAATLSDEQTAHWTRFYATPLGRKLAKADADAASAEFQASSMKQAPKVMEELAADPARMALLQSWLQATDAVEQTTRLAMQFQLAMEWGLISTAPSAPGKPTFKDLQAHMDRQRFAVKAQMAQLVLAQSAIAYKDFSLQDLRGMLKQANAPQGKVLYVEFGRRFAEVLVGLAEKVGQVAGQKLAQQSV